MKILSTKVLTQNQKDLLKGFEVKEVPMIDISFFKDFVLDEKVQNAIFTSANSVKSVFEIHKNKTNLFDTVFCVGTKTQYLLEQQGLEVEVVANNALELANTLVDRLVKNPEDLSEVSWFCGNIKNNHLAPVMAENGILITEYEVYKTELISQEIQEEFDAVLFFSPSGVRSYLKKNNPIQKPIICIGVTTATEALNSFDEVYMADETTVESVIEKVKEII